MVLESFFITLGALLFFHALFDYALQTDFIAKHKCSCNSLDAIPWYYVLWSHAMLHAGGVYLATEFISFAVIELICHFAIDWSKCNKQIDIHTDQILHIVIKLLFAVAIASYSLEVS